MISSKTVKLFLLSLVVSLSMNSIIVSAHSIVQDPPTTRIGSRSSSGGVRGSSSLRWLQNNDNLDSADDTDSLLSMDSNETSSVDNNYDNSVDDDEDDQRRNSRFVAPRARQCTTEQDSNEVEFQCKSIKSDSMSEIEDELKFKVRATSGNYLQITVSYESEVETAQSETETETQYTVVFDRLIEYRKIGNAADDHYEWNVDEVVAEWPLNTWEPLSDIQTMANNRTVFTATTGMVTFTFTISQTDSEDHTTNKMKIDFLLENYPWDASGNTYIALVSRIETEREIEMDDGGEDQVSDVLINFKDAVDTIGFVPFGEYTWATTAEATFVATTTSGNSTSLGMEDGAMNSTNVMLERSTTTGQNQTTTIEVIASKSSSTSVGGTSADSTLEEIAFSFVGAGQGANRIYWDPEAGIGYTSSASSQLVSSFVLSALSLGLILLW